MSRRAAEPNMHQLEFAMRFLCWASTFRRPITRDDIVARWDVSRATAYRYLAAYERAIVTGRQLAALGAAGHGQVQA